MNNVKIEAYCRRCNKSYPFYVVGKNTLAEMSKNMIGWHKVDGYGKCCPSCVKEVKNGRAENIK